MAIITWCSIVLSMPFMIVLLPPVESTNQIIDSEHTSVNTGNPDAISGLT